MQHDNAAKRLFVSVCIYFFSSLVSMKNKMFLVIFILKYLTSIILRLRERMRVKECTLTFQ